MYKCDRFVASGGPRYFVKNKFRLPLSVSDDVCETLIIFSCEIIAFLYIYIDRHIYRWVVDHSGTDYYCVWGIYINKKNDSWRKTILSHFWVVYLLCDTSDSIELYKTARLNCS